MTDHAGPYFDGYQAGCRTGKYAIETPTPFCPFPDGSKEADEWWRGYNDGNMDYIAFQAT